MNSQKTDYSVPENIRKLKPRGTMVKRLHGNYYVYGMKSVKDPDTGKWKTKTTGILGKITEEDGYIPNSDKGYTILEYGAYQLARECASEISDSFFASFGKGDTAKRIWTLALIYAVNGFRPISSINLIYAKSCLSVIYPDLKLGSTAVANLLDNLGRRDTESLAFQKLISKETTEIAIDGHVIPRYSDLDGMTEFGYKYKKIGSKQVNMLTAFDTVRNRPFAMKMFDGSKTDKISGKELIEDINIRGCLYLIDRGFYSDGIKGLITSFGSTYIVPLSANLKAYKEAFSTRGRGRLNTFIYTKREGMHIRKDAVEYRVVSDIDGVKTIYYRNVQEAAEQESNYLDCIEKEVPGHTMEGLGKARKSFGVIVLETTHNGEPKDIYFLYKKRWEVETYFNYLKNQMDFNALGIQDWAKLQGLAFMMLLATLIRSSIQEKVRQSEINGTYMPEILLTASSVKAIKRSDYWTIENASKHERSLFDALDIELGSTLE